jgi:hypothetical protein
MVSQPDICASQCVCHIDLTATKHMTRKGEVFPKIANCDNEIIILGDDSVHEVHGRGEVPMTISRDCIKNIHNVLYVPSVMTNLLSVRKFTAEKYIVVFL